jgi:tetratricopeptide (TPR) repeat protein
MRRSQKAGSDEVRSARVFISATSKDLGTIRELVKQALLTMDCMPVEQTNFPPDYRSVREMLEQKIRTCEAVIHIVGIQYGAEPDPKTLPEGAIRRSYTQMEADLARQLGKKLYLFVCPENFPYDSAAPEEEEKQALQRSYRQEAAKSEEIRNRVTDREEIARKIRELQFELENLRATIGRDRRRHALLIAGLIVVLSLLVGGVAYVVSLSRSTHRDVARIERSNRDNLEAVGAELISLQKQLAQAGQSLSDLKPEAIYKQLSRRLKMSEEEIASLIAIGKRSRDLSEQAAAAIAALDFDKAESLYVQAASSQEQNFLKAAGDLLGAARAAILGSRFAEAIKYCQRADGAVIGAGGNDTDLWFDVRDTWIVALYGLGTRTTGADAIANVREALDMANKVLAKISPATATERWIAFQLNRTAILSKLGESVTDANHGFFKESIAVCHEILKFCDRKRFPEEWARTQRNLASVLRDLGIRSPPEEGRDYLKQSLSAIRAGLEQTTKENSPEDWALTETELGNILRELAVLSSPAECEVFLEQSCAAYRSGLEVLSFETFPKSWAIAQTDLAIALCERARRAPPMESRQFFEQSSTAYEAALRVYTREQHPQDWALAQSGLSDILCHLSDVVSPAESERYLRRSVAAADNALEIYTREQFPQLWAGAQLNRANALQALGVRASDEEGLKCLHEAYAAYLSAAEVYTRNEHAQNWATLQGNLANVLGELGGRSSGDEAEHYLQQSCEFYRKALEVRTQEQMPNDWAMTQKNLSMTLRDLSALHTGEQRNRDLMEAIGACRNALKVYTRDRLPNNWAETQNTLGIAFLALGQDSDLRTSQDYLEQAVTASRNALEVITKANAPQYWAMIQNNLGLALKELAARNSDKRRQLLGDAITAFQNAVQIFTPESNPRNNATIQHNLEVAQETLNEGSD